MTQPRYRLHTTDLSPYGQRVCLAIRVKSLDEHFEYVDTFGGTDALRAQAPMAQIPLLESPDGVLPESQLIVDYLDRVHPDPALRSDAPMEAAQQALIGRMVDLYLAPHTIALITAMRGVLSPAAIGEAAVLHARGLGYIESYLTEGPFAIGDTLSIADLAYGPFLFYAPALASWHDIDDPLTDLPKSRTLFANLQKRPAFETTFEKMDAAFAKRCEDYPPK